MKKRTLTIWIALIWICLSLTSVLAQEKKTADKAMKNDKVNMMEMQKSSAHAIMMAHRQNVLTFTKALRDMAKLGKFEDVELARNALVEIKRGMEKMDEIHQAHMGKMSVEMRKKMKPMMEKMQAEKAAASEHIRALEKALEADSPSPEEAEKHATALVLQLEKMGMSDMKMAMPSKSKM